MSSITLLAILVLATVSVSAQVVEVDRVAGNLVFFTVRNNRESPLKLSFQDDNLVFPKVELWDCGKGVRLVSKVFQKFIPSRKNSFPSTYAEPYQTPRLDPVRKGAGSEEAATGTLPAGFPNREWPIVFASLRLQVPLDGAWKQRPWFSRRTGHGSAFRNPSARQPEAAAPCPQASFGREIFEQGLA